MHMQHGRRYFPFRHPLPIRERLHRTDTAAVLDSFPAGIPYDPEQVLQPLLIPENPDLEPDTRMPE